jgi:hypothetical protein
VELRVPLKTGVAHEAGPPTNQLAPSGRQGGKGQLSNPVSGPCTSGCLRSPWNHTTSCRLSVPNGYTRALVRIFSAFLFILCTSATASTDALTTRYFLTFSFLFIAGRRSIRRASAPEHNAVDVDPVSLVAGHVCLGCGSGGRG